MEKVIKALELKFGLEGMEKEIYPVGADYIECVSFKSKNEMYVVYYPRFNKGILTYDFIKYKKYGKEEQRVKIIIHKNCLEYETRGLPVEVERDFYLTVDDSVNFFEKMPKEIEEKVSRLKTEYTNFNGMESFYSIINALEINAANIINAGIPNVFTIEYRKITYDRQASDEEGYEMTYDYKGYQYSEKDFSLMERKDGKLELTLIGNQNEIEAANVSGAIIKAQKEIEKLKTVITQFNN